MYNDNDVEEIASFMHELSFDIPTERRKFCKGAVMVRTMNEEIKNLKKKLDENKIEKEILERRMKELMNEI